MAATVAEAQVTRPVETYHLAPACNNVLAGNPAPGAPGQSAPSVRLLLVKLGEIRQFLRLYCEFDGPQLEYLVQVFAALGLVRMPDLDKIIRRHVLHDLYRELEEKHRVLWADRMAIFTGIEWYIKDSEEIARNGGASK